MYPIIFQYKMITIGGYGIMLGLAFYLAFLLSERELKLRNMDPELAYKVLITIVPSAIIGAKIFHILDYFKEFLNDPIAMIFSGSGLSVLGGFVLSFVTASIVIKRNNYKILEVFDLASPAMALGYFIGRLGCHMAGDPCYGIQTTTLFGTAYPNGLAPVSFAVFPTPLFESLFAFISLLILMQLRKRLETMGKVFSVFLILHGISRFIVEFLRTNPKIGLGLTQAQYISIGFMLLGIMGLVLLDKFHDKMNSFLAKA